MLLGFCPIRSAGRESKQGCVGLRIIIITSQSEVIRQLPVLYFISHKKTVMIPVNSLEQVILGCGMLNQVKEF